MLHWPPGRRETDGVWAKYWYESVERSSGFERWPRSTEPLPAPLADIEREARPLHAAMHVVRIRPTAAGSQSA